MRRRALPEVIDTADPFGPFTPAPAAPAAPPTRTRRQRIVELVTLVKELIAAYRWYLSHKAQIEAARQDVKDLAAALQGGNIPTALAELKSIVADLQAVKAAAASA